MFFLCIYSKKKGAPKKPGRAGLGTYMKQICSRHRIACPPRLFLRTEGLFPTGSSLQLSTLSRNFRVEILLEAQSLVLSPWWGRFWKNLQALDFPVEPTETSVGLHCSPAFLFLQICSLSFPHWYRSWDHGLIHLLYAHFPLRVFFSANWTCKSC